MLALHNYTDKHGAFPPACTLDANGRPLHSWRTLILPHLDDDELTRLSRSIDLSRAWDDPANAHACSAQVRLFQCAEADPGQLSTRYLAVVASGSFLQAGEPRRLSDVSDDLGQTLILVEVDADHAVPWMAPSDADEPLLLAPRSSSSLGHQRVVLLAMVDGSVVALDAETRSKWFEHSSRLPATVPDWPITDAGRVWVAGSDEAA